MTKMAIRKLAVLGCIAVQFIVLAAMVFDRESIIHRGQEIFLTTVPLDPNDPFRGEFVRLRYAMNQPDGVEMDWEQRPKKGERVYVTLQNLYGNVWAPEKLTSERPRQGVFLRGRSTGHQFGFRGIAKFGIEQYFVEQGQGIEIETKQGLRGGFSTPLLAQLSVADNGSAVITGIRWEPFAIQAEILKRDAAADSDNLSSGSDNAGVGDDEIPPTVLRVTIKNTSDKQAALYNPGNNCGLRLVSTAVAPATAEFEMASDCPEVNPNGVVVVAPQQEMQLDLNLADPRWHVRVGDDPVERTLPPGQAFSVVYQAPSNDKISNGTNSNGKIRDSSQPVWQGELRSRPLIMSQQNIRN